MSTAAPAGGEPSGNTSAPLTTAVVAPRSLVDAARSVTPAAGTEPA